MIQVKGMEFCSQTEFVLLKYALDYCPEAITVNYVDKTWLGRLMIHFSLRTTCFSNGESLLAAIQLSCSRLFTMPFRPFLS